VVLQGLDTDRVSDQFVYLPIDSLIQIVLCGVFAYPSVVCQLHVLLFMGEQVAWAGGG
jgi:hypothetical protein